MAKKEKIPSVPLDWQDLTHRARAMISMDCEPNFVRSMLDRAVLTLSEDQIEQIEASLRSCDTNKAKDIIFYQFMDCVFDDVHIDQLNGIKH